VPIYEYACRKCGNEFELMRRVAEMDAAAKCPACASKATKRKLSTFALARGADPDVMTDEFDPDDRSYANPDGFGGGDDWDDDY
jgi:putative FmdB family regulatory protein